ncbi:MAG: hypothetical protein ACR2QE_05750 [Acidimicrobiales bacterium]
MTGEGLATVRIFDVTVHCWDLARAIGGSEDLPRSIVDHAWSYAVTHYPRDQSGRPDTHTTPNDNPDDTLVALLMLTGRSPEGGTRE